jgi:hypothetical protein
MFFDRLIAAAINIAPIIIITTEKIVIAMATTDSSLSDVEVAAAAHEREFVIQIIVTVIAAIAVAYFSFRSWNAGNKLQDALNADAQARIEEAKRDSKVGLAKADAEIARLKVENANLYKESQALQLEVAKAKKDAEQEKIERLKLEAQVAPRRLTREQQKAIAAALKPFSGRNVGLFTYVYDLEGAILASQIKPALVEAGISVQDRTSTVMIIGGFTAGISVSGPDSEQGLVRAIADSLRRDAAMENYNLLEIRELPNCPVYSRRRA